MKEIQTDELRELQMKILDYVDSFCRNNDVKYSISGGTLLGAVRHGGFIPWDDDIDIQMLRDEYIRFTELWNAHDQHGPYELINVESGNNLGYAFGKIHDTRTITYIGDYARTGVFIDVFPMDGVVDKSDFLKRHTKVKKLYGLRSKAFSEKLGDKGKKLMDVLFWIKNSSKMTFEEYAIAINNVASEKQIEECPLVFEMVSGMICKEPMPKSIFESFKDIPFEDRVYMSVLDYDTYLRMTFGNYMQLPPVEQRKTHHSYKAYWK